MSPDANWDHGQTVWSPIFIRFRNIYHLWHMHNETTAFETTSLLYVTPTNSTSMQELLMQEHKQKLYKTCSCCGRDTWHIESKTILQPPSYLIIVNRITYSNNRITKIKSRIPLDLYIEPGPYKFSLQASVDHHGYSYEQWPASINCGKTFHCNDNKNYRM